MPTQKHDSVRFEIINHTQKDIHLILYTGLHKKGLKREFRKDRVLLVGSGYRPQKHLSMVLVSGGFAYKEYFFSHFSSVC
jgi:hypothetical protein